MGGLRMHVIWLVDCSDDGCTDGWWVGGVSQVASFGCCLVLTVLA